MCNYLVTSSILCSNHMKHKQYECTNMQNIFQLVKWSFSNMFIRPFYETLASESHKRCCTQVCFVYILQFFAKNVFSLLCLNGIYKCTTCHAYAQVNKNVTNNTFVGTYCLDVVHTTKSKSIFNTCFLHQVGSWNEA
jgi:hypothetical protein